MLILRGIKKFTQRSIHPVVTIGNFDGVHLGHQKIIDLAIQQAKSRGGLSIALTFKPHPQAALNPQREIQLLTTYAEKIEIFEGLGIDITIEEPFSRKFSTTGPEEFFNEVLLKQIGAECIIVGYDFGFGKNRGGHLDVLRELCQAAQVELIVVSPMRLESDIVSSSRIRAELLRGQIPEANHLLGRRFSYQGIVSHGEGRGRKLGFPTANLKPENKLTLPFGVYATYSTFGAQTYPSITNIGVRPTFQEVDSTALSEALVETHLLDQSLDLYGHRLEVSFIQRLRTEQKFNSLEALKSQIRVDIETARKCHKADASRSKPNGI